MVGRRVPLWIAFLVLVDVALIVLPALDFWVGQPFARLTSLINLNSENSVQAWYSSMQWFCAGVLFAVGALHLLRTRVAGLASLAALAGLCIVFSVDEIAAVHEWLGQKSDALLPGGDRANTAFWRTGIWPFLIGVPVLAMLSVIVAGLRRIYLPRSRRGLVLLIAGLVVMFTGALLVELGANLLDPGPENEGVLLLRLACEEFLEMLGVTVVVWSAYELLRAFGFALQAPAARYAHVPPVSSRELHPDSIGARWTRVLHDNLHRSVH